MLGSLMLAGVLIAAVSGVAHAAANPAMCTNDTDCVATPQCGGDVCNFGTNPPTCAPATMSGSGSEGWCTSTDPNGGDDGCKCKAQGAHCVLTYCSFTVPPPSGAAGSSGAAGATGAAGSTGAAGATGAAGSTGAAGAGGTKTSSSSGGCSIASSTSGGFAALVGLALVAGGLVRRRRRA
jgi:pilus assembly protein FimV